MANRPIIGIDLGTTNSVVGVWVDGRVEILRNEQSKRLTPSCVAFEDNRRFVGDSAKYLERVNYKNTITNSKRLLGKTYSETSDLRTTMPFTIQNDNEQTIIAVQHQGETTLHLEEVSAMILMKMKGLAETYLKADVGEAIITVPAHFTNIQRRSTLNAAKIAGLNVLGLINETTAAALTFGVTKRPEGKRKVLIFDLGGGSLDVSIVSIENGSDYKVLATTGDPSLGGEDFTNCLVNFLAEKYLIETNKDIRSDMRAMTRLKCEAEKAKQTLSISKDARIEVDSIQPGSHFETTVSREDFKNASEELLTRVLILIKSLADNFMDLDDFVLVGGSSRLPIVQSIIQENFKELTLNLSLNQDEAVAYGATLYAAKINGVQDFQLQEITSYKFGTDGEDTSLSTFFEVGTYIPCKREIQKWMKNDKVLRIYEGVSSLIEESVEIGRFEVNSEYIQVFLDRNGIFNVHTQEQGLIINEREFDAGQLNAWLQSAKKFQEEDEREEKRLATRNDIEGFAYKLKQTVKKKEVDQTVKRDLLDLISDFIDWLEENQSEAEEVYKAKKEKLEDDYENIVRKNEEQTSLVEVDEPRQESATETRNIRHQETEEDAGIESCQEAVDELENHPAINLFEEQVQKPPVAEPVVPSITPQQRQNLQGQQTSPSWRRPAPLPPTVPQPKSNQARPNDKKHKTNRFSMQPNQSYTREEVPPRTRPKSYAFHQDNTHDCVVTYPEGSRRGDDSSEQKHEIHTKRAIHDQRDKKFQRNEIQNVKTPRPSSSTYYGCRVYKHLEYGGKYASIFETLQANMVCNTNNTKNPEVLYFVEIGSECKRIHNSRPEKFYILGGSYNILIHAEVGENPRRVLWYYPGFANASSDIYVRLDFETITFQVRIHSTNRLVWEHRADVHFGKITHRTQPPASQFGPVQ